MYKYYKNDQFVHVCEHYAGILDQWTDCHSVLIYVIVLCTYCTTGQLRIFGSSLLLLSISIHSCTRLLGPFFKAKQSWTLPWIGFDHLGTCTFHFLYCLNKISFKQCNYRS